MYIFIISLIIFVCVLLVLVVLAQNSKGGGLTSQFGGSGASNLIGVKKTGDLLERLTWGLAIGIMVLTLATNFSTPNASSGDDILQDVRDQQVLPANAPKKAADSTAKP